MYTSFNLSKKLKEAGCELESKEFYHNERRYCIDNQIFGHITISDKPKAYDILWEICVEYKKEFFLEWERNARELLFLLQIKKPQKEIEKYIWDNCLFNPKNKGK